MDQFRSFDDVSLSYLDEGNGPLAVLLHGFASEHRGNWVAPGVVAALVAAGHRVIAPDARGHGSSDKPHEPAAYANGALVRDVRSLLDHLGATSASVVGYSMGSLTAARLAPVEPRVTRVVLGGVGGNMAEDGPRNSGAIADALVADDPSTITDPVARAFRAFADSTHADRLALAAIQRSPRWDSLDLGAISVPTLVVTGDKDTLVGRADDLAARIPGAGAVTVVGDHLTAVSDPAFATAIVDFLGPR